MSDDRATRARSFGQVAERYDRYRPGYPAELLDDVMALAPGRRVLEAGAGTGRATLELARRGASIVAAEPDPAMAAVAAERTCGLAVEILPSPFEEVEVEAGSFDLVVSAQAWHWVDPVAGAAVARHALGPGGVLALWWNRPRAQDGPVWAAIHEVYARLAPDLDRREQLATQEERERVTEPAAGVGPWERRRYDWSQTYDAESYAALVSTHSDHLALPPGQRDELLSAVREAIDRSGGHVEYPYRTVLLWARPGGAAPESRSP